MPTGELIKPPRKYWIGVCLAAAFVLFGLVATLGIAVRDPATINAQLGFTPDLPFWLLLGVAIFGEIAGIFGLFMRRAWATPPFGLSVIFTLLYYAYVLTKNGWQSPVGPIIITLLHVVLLWFAVVSARRGWTRRGV